MNVKTALLLVFALTFQPILASSESSWYQDPIVWVTAGAAAVTSYFMGGRLKEGLKVVLPTALTSTLVVGAGVGSWVLRKFDRTYVVAIIPVLLVGTYIIYKALIVCPQKGTQGCTCGMSS